MSIEQTENSTRREKHDENTVCISSITLPAAFHLGLANPFPYADIRELETRSTNGGEPFSRCSDKIRSLRRNRRNHLDNDSALRSFVLEIATSLFCLFYRKDRIHRLHQDRQIKNRRIKRVLLYIC
ncbi:hypothetical protein PUN28_018040 [Cardiocondyla obscurior]|uniref:Uncharacterized protein n=1 Tax=Cardiocondyla obscurior TaxID=286306 RepID=A0AAW2EGJ6_9HYME